MIGEIRAARAAFLPARAKHEMVHDELALPIEELGERLLAARRVENVRLVHLDPRQLATLGAQLVACPGEFLLLGEKRLALSGPFALGDDLVLHTCATPLVGTRDAQSGLGVIQPTPAPPGCMRMAIRPTPGTSKIGFISLAPALTALATRLSTSSTAR